MKEPQSDASSYNLAELINLFEIACAIYLEGSVSGNSRRLMADYLNNVLTHLVKTPSTNEHVLQLLQTEKTFEFIKKFLKKLKEKPSILSGLFRRSGTSLTARQEASPSAIPPLHGLPIILLLDTCLLCSSTVDA